MSRIIPVAKKTLEKYSQAYLVESNEFALTGIYYGNEHVLTYNPSPQQNPFKLFHQEDPKVANLAYLREHDVDFSLVRNLREIESEYNILKTIPNLGEIGCSYIASSNAENLSIFYPTTIERNTLRGLFLERREDSRNENIDILSHHSLLRELKTYMVENFFGEIEKYWLKGDDAREFLLQKQYHKKVPELCDLLDVEEKPTSATILPFRK